MKFYTICQAGEVGQRSKEIEFDKSFLWNANHNLAISISMSLMLKLLLKCGIFHVDLKIAPLQ